jgi:glycosyltransferase involved in cell wall biosynthesis
MHITYVSTIYPPAIGGAQLHLHYLAKGILELGNEVNVITHTSRYRRDWLRLSTLFPEHEKNYEFEGIPVSQIGFSALTRFRMLPWVLIYYPFLGTAVKKISSYMLFHFCQLAPVPTLIHATRIGREFISRASMDFAHKRGIPFILTPNHHPRWKGFLYKEYDKIYREADALIALTSAERQLFIEEKGVSEDRIYITGIGPLLSEKYSIGEFRDRFGISDRFVLFIGQQLKYKGIASIIKATPIVWEKHPDVKFVFIGPETNYSKILFKDVKDSRIINLGQVDLETKTAALAACEFLCLPSIQESFGGVIIEAWSLRKAVIGGQIPAIASVVKNGHDGLLSTQSPYELAEAISYLLSNPAHCEAMGNTGWAKVLSNYTWEKLAKKTCSVYQKLCS